MLVLFAGKYEETFVRYADDCMIFCRSELASERISKFIEGKFFLKVNRDKTGCGKRFLGYSFYFDRDDKCQLRLHPKTIDKQKSTLKKLTSRSNGMGYVQRKEALKLFISGWVEYYKVARMKTILETIDAWLRRIRMCIWKSRKNPKTRMANLIKCDVTKWRAYKIGRILYRAGYRCLMDYYVLVL